jgi:hypothetical protein
VGIGTAPQQGELAVDAVEFLHESRVLVFREGDADRFFVDGAAVDFCQFRRGDDEVGKLVAVVAVERQLPPVADERGLELVEESAVGIGVQRQL